MPLVYPPLKTFPMHHYLEEDLIERLGIKDEVFTSGSFTLYKQDGSIVEAAKKHPTRQTQVSDADDEEESKGPRVELEVGQI